VSRQTLWGHQLELQAGIRAEWARGIQRVAGVLPTGGGKTTTFVDTAEGWLEQNPGRRVVVIAHRTELIEQAAARVQAHTGLAVGVVKAARNQTRAPIVVASVQSLASSGGRRARQIADVGLVIVDECHRAAARTYVEALTTFGCYREGGALALGVTATLSRSDRLSLGAVWQSVVEGPTIMDGVRGGWLVRPHGLLVRVEDLSFKNVRISGGDYRAGDLGEALVDSLAPTRIAEAYREHAEARQGIVFTPTVAAAEVVCAALVTEGFTAEVVHGGTPSAERAAIVQRYRDGECQILVNCSVFTEGTDLPATSCIVVARPTKSNGLYVQMVGRGLRLAPGKSDCLVLDVCGASRRNRLQAHVDLFGDKDPLAQEEAPEREELEDVELEEEVAPDDPVFFATPGDLVVEIVDLFAGSNAGWQRTRAGVWFIPTRERYLAVLPGMTPDGGFDVWSVPKDVTRMWDSVRYGVADLVGARTMAEAQVATKEKIRADGRRWGSPAPSVPQVRLAGRLGIGVAPGMTGGEVSTLIDCELATRRIDPWLPVTMFGASV
jgi:superfamily II DNA or RNA helicase